MSEVVGRRKVQTESDYSVRIVLSAERCKRLRRLVAELGRDPSEILSLGLDLFWLGSGAGKDGVYGRVKYRNGRCVPRKPAIAVAVAECVEVRFD